MESGKPVRKQLQKSREVWSRVVEPMESKKGRRIKCSIGRQKKADLVMDLLVERDPEDDGNPG